MALIQRWIAGEERMLQDLLEGNPLAGVTTEHPCNKVSGTMRHMKTIILINFQDVLDTTTGEDLEGLIMRGTVKRAASQEDIEADSQ